MDVTKYIESGILELYVGGALTEQESVEVTKMANLHPEIKQEIELIEKTFISFATKGVNKLDLPSLESIVEKIENLPQKTVSPPLSKVTETTKPKIGSPVISIMWKYVAVAASLLLFASLFTNYNLYQNLQKSTTKLAQLENEKLQLAQEFQTFKADYNNLRTDFAAIRTPNTKTIRLDGLKDENHSALVFWDTKNETVYLDVNQLPTPPQGKTYQLWALPKLEPLTPNDAGAIPQYISGGDNFFKVKNVNEALAFAITLEPMGGSQSPTLDELYVLGKL